MYKQECGAEMSATVGKRAGQDAVVGFENRWEFVCRDKHGNIKWTDHIDNIVVNAGLDYILDAGLSGGTQVTTWYVGLLSDSPTVAAADTMASHSGWTEVTAYDEATRQTWTDGGVSGQSVSNSGSPAVFTISTNGTDIGGAFLVSDDTKGGSTGTLYAAGAFSAGDKSLDDGDVLSVTCTATAAAA
jgi:hypothetical protein